MTCKICYKIQVKSAPYFVNCTDKRQWIYRFLGLSYLSTENSDHLDTELGLEADA